MKIALGRSAYLDTDEGERPTPFHKRIVRLEEVPNSAGHKVVLECGHRMLIFSPLQISGGIAVCPQCRCRAGREE